MIDNELLEELVRQHNQREQDKFEAEMARNAAFKFLIVRTWNKFRRSQPAFGFTKLSEREQRRVVGRFNDYRSARAHLARLSYRYKTHDFKHQLLEDGNLVEMDK